MQSPSFQKAVTNSIIFTIVAQIVVIVCSTILAIALEKPFRGRGIIRFLILLPWVAPVSLGTIGWKWILDSIYSVITWVLIWLGFVSRFNPPMWLGEDKAGDGIGDPGDLLALDPIFYGDPAGRPYSHSQRNSRGRSH